MSHDVVKSNWANSDLSNPNSLILTFFTTCPHKAQLSSSFPLLIMWHLHPLNCFCQRPDSPLDKELADAGHISPTKPLPVPAWCPITRVFQLHHPNMRPQHLSSALFPELSLLSPFYLFSSSKSTKSQHGPYVPPCWKPFKIYPNSSSWPTRAMFYLVLGLSLHPLPHLLPFAHWPTFL